MSARSRRSIRVVAFSSLTGRPLTVSLHERYSIVSTRHHSSERKRQRSVTEIQAAACAHFGLSSRSSLLGSGLYRLASAGGDVPRPRADQRNPTVDRRHFGGRDHATVLYAWRRTTAHIAADDASREAVEKLCSQLGLDPSQAQSSAPTDQPERLPQICPQSIHRRLPDCSSSKPSSQPHSPYYLLLFY